MNTFLHTLQNSLHDALKAMFNMNIIKKKNSQIPNINGNFTLKS